MNRLWSPWRSQYISSFKDEDRSDKCIFCGQEDADIENETNLIVYKDKLVFVVLNLYPYNSGHLMVVPYRHLSSVHDLTAEENTAVMKNIQLSARALEEAMKPQGFNMGANFGRVAGAGIDQHIHFHLVPRWNGDINFMPAIGEVKVISQDLLETKRSLVGVFKALAQAEFPKV